MTKLLIIAGLTFEVGSPSAYCLLGCDLWLLFDGKTWILHGEDNQGQIYLECKSRDEAAGTIAKAIDDTRKVS